MKFYRVKDDIEKLMDELTYINLESKKIFKDLRRDNSRVSRKSRGSSAKVTGRKSLTLNDDNFDGEASLLDEENSAAGSKVIKFYEK